MSTLKKTALHALHKSKKAVMAEFAGYDMPISYPGMGVLKEHLYTREAAGIFDVSHMGQYQIRGADRERFIEYATPVDLARVAPGSGALTMITNERGGIKDDCIVSKFDDHLHVVLNAGCKEKDVAHLEALRAEFKGDVTIVELPRALVALQGPKAAAILASLAPADLSVPDIDFMQSRRGVVLAGGIAADVTRCGYTGEDGFEIAVENGDAAALVEALLAGGGAQLIGLGARDSLRLEAGLNLYGHELTEDTNPVAARFMWAISKRRMEEGGFLGHDAIRRFKEDSSALVPQLRVGFVAGGGPVARDGAAIEVGGRVVGRVTSGCPSPCLKKNIGLGYVERAHATKGTEVQLVVRDRRVPAVITPPPFVPARQYRKPASK